MTEIICCEHPIYISKDGFFVCTNCGSVQFQSFDIAESHVCNIHLQNETKENCGFRTFIHKSDINHYVHPKYTPLFNRMARLQSECYTTKEKKMFEFNEIMKSLSTHFHFSYSVSSKETITMLYQKVISNQLLKGTTRELMVYAIVYFVLVKIYNYPYSIYDFCPPSVPKEEFLKSISRPVKRIATNASLLGISIKKCDLRYYIQRYGYILEFSSHRIAYAQIMFKFISEKIAPNKNLISAILYIAGKTPLNSVCQRRTQKKVGDVIGLTELTVRSWIQKIEKKYPNIEYTDPKNRHNQFKFKFYQ